jgi:hypothetical protein
MTHNNGHFMEKNQRKEIADQIALASRELEAILRSNAAGPGREEGLDFVAKCRVALGEIRAKN